MSEYSYSYWWRLRVFSGARGKAPIKAKIAWLIRSIADLIDGQASISWRFYSSPSVPIQYQADCIRKGVEHAQKLMIEAVETESLETTMREAAPQLYEEGE